MATKTTTKLTAAKKAAKPTTKRKSTKVTARNTVSPSTVQRSFRVTPSQRPFMTFSLTRDTLYWSILSLAVLALGAWVINLQVSINQIYDKIEQEQVVSDSLDEQYLQAVQKKNTPSQ